MPNSAEPLNSQLRSLPGLSADGEVARFLAGAAVRDELRRWCRISLASHHLIAVARSLRQVLGASVVEMRELGVPTDLLDRFPDWRRGTRKGFRPRRLNLTPMPVGAADPMGSIRLQLSPAGVTIPHAMQLLRCLLRTTDPAVEIAVVVRPGAHLADLHRVVEIFGRQHSRRVRFAELETATTFAQDNARGMRDSSGDPVLLIPRDFGQSTGRSQDALTEATASQALEVRVVRSALHWDGGNILHTSEFALIGVDTLRENMARLGLSRSEVVRIFEAELGVRVHVIGDLRTSRWDASGQALARSGQADFHIDLDVALLGVFGKRRKPTAIIADPVRGLELLPAVLSHRPLVARGFLGPRRTLEVIANQYDEHAHVRHPKLLGYCALLEKLGFRVIGVPDLRVAQEENVFSRANLDFSYCNLLPGLNRGRPSVHYLPWGIHALDGAADEQFRAAGVMPIRVARSGDLANEFMQLRGGLHCLCGPWR